MGCEVILKGHTKELCLTHKPELPAHAQKCSKFDFPVYRKGWIYIEIQWSLALIHLSRWRLRARNHLRTPNLHNLLEQQQYKLLSGLAQKEPSYKETEMKARHDEGSKGMTSDAYTWDDKLITVFVDSNVGIARTCSILQYKIFSNTKTGKLI